MPHVCSLQGPQQGRAWGAALPVLYSTFSALVGTQSVLFSKTLAVLLRATFDGDNQVCVHLHLATHLGLGLVFTCLSQHQWTGG